MAVATGPATGIIEAAVSRWPERPCIDFLGAKWTYREVGDLIDRAAAGFRRLGVEKGTRVGLCLPNTPYYVICWFAVLKAGGIVVNFNPLYVERELKHQIDDAGTTIMVTLDLEVMYPKVAGLLGKSALEKVVVCPMAGILPPVKRVLFTLFKGKERSKIPADGRHVTFAELTSKCETLPAMKVDPENDIAVLQYTGGATGGPKGAMLTHANITANAEQIVRWVPERFLGERPKMLGVLPLFHVFAMTVVQNFGLRLGAELILLPRFELAQVMDVIEKQKPSIFPGVPTIYTAINSAAEKGGRDLSSVQICISGGAPLPVEVRTRFEALTGCKLVEGYGLTEASPVVTCNPVDGVVKAGSIGLALPDTTLSIRTPVTCEAEMATGEKGEVCVKGPQVMRGYWKRPGETAEQFHAGWLRTGDIGYRDEDGYVFLVDRIKDIIICGGYNVYPRAIEEALNHHPAVEEVTVIGVPDKYRGQAPKAFVKLRAGQSATPDDLHAFLGDWLSKIEMPREIEIRDALPKTMVGKLSKKELVAEEAANIDLSGAVAPESGTPRDG